ncbi:MAG: hypothetical protein H5T32_07685 [Candidatus Methanosuratus sp.]|nr:hypothetical protein [Candidatus Methanosuratincola sp.]
MDRCCPSHCARSDQSECGSQQGEIDAEPDFSGGVEDPLAYYAPYPSHIPSPKKWGIFFRARKMLDDFIDFHSRLPKFILPDFSWRVYVMTVFWHEMAHHVVQDAQMIINGPPPYEYAAYSLMPRQDEESFCEYMAFTAVERNLGLPPKVIRNIPMRHMLYARIFYPHPRPKIPLLPGRSPMKPDYFRIYALCALYDHWGRGSDPVYRPCVTRTASGAVGPLWNPLWEAHQRGAPVITLGPGEGDLIWDRIFVTER